MSQGYFADASHRWVDQTQRRIMDAPGRRALDRARARAARARRRGRAARLPALEPVVARDGVAHLDARELVGLHVVSLEQLLLLAVGEHLVLGHEDVLCDVHEQLALVELLDVQLALLRLEQALPRKRSEGLADHDDPAKSLLRLHLLRARLRAGGKGGQGGREGGWIG